VKEIRLNGVVLRPTSRGWQVGEVAWRTRDGKRVEHLVRIKHFSHEQLPKACGVFASRAAALGPDAPDLNALVKDAIAVEQAAIEKALRPTRKRKKDGPRIYVRVSDAADLELLKGAAKSQGVPVAEFVRAAALEDAYDLVGR
jgi:hypothetical protein